jgi:hypothetical protein
MFSDTGTHFSDIEILVKNKRGREEASLLRKYNVSFFNYVDLKTRASKIFGTAIIC